MTLWHTLIACVNELYSSYGFTNMAKPIHAWKGFVFNNMDVTDRLECSNFWRR